MRPLQYVFCLLAAVGACVSDSSNMTDGGGNDATTDMVTVDVDAGLEAAASCDATGGCPDDVLEVSAGYHVACARHRNGTVSCWGSNQFAALGAYPSGADSTNAAGVHYRSKPTTIAGLSNAAQISVGGDYVCALDMSQDVWCWGSNAEGWLGHDVSLDIACNGPDGGAAGTCNQAPMKVQTTPSGVKFVEVRAGSNSVCARSTSNDVYCWGSNVDGLAGQDPTKVNSETTATKILSSGLDGHCAGLYMPLGAGFNCGRKDDGTVWCWGYDYQGRLGVPPSTLPGGITGTPVSVLMADGGVLGGVTAMTTASNTGCVQTSGGILCWGGNEFGGFANGSWDTAAHPSPMPATAVPTGATLIGAPGSDVSFAHDTSGNVIGWGANAFGGLGLGTTNGGGTGGAGQPCAFSTSCVGTPQQAPALKDMKQLSSGLFFTVGLKGDGTVWAWGGNDDGQLGHDPNAGGAGDMACSGDSYAFVCNPAPSQVSGL